MVRAPGAYAAFRLGPGFVNVHGDSPAAVRTLARGWTTATPTAGDKDVVLDVTIVDGPSPPDTAERQGDAGDGIETASDGQWLWWRRGGAWTAIAAGERPVGMVVDAREPSWRVAPASRSAARRALEHVGAVAAHGSLVDYEGGGILLTGWSESGKTEVALALAAALRGGLASDKWVVLRDGTAWGTPGAAGLRDWVVPYLADSLGRTTRLERLRLASGGLIRRGTRVLSRARAIHPAADAVGAPLARLAEQVPVLRRPPSTILRGPGRGGEGGAIPLRAAVLLLSAADGPVQVPLDRGELERRIALTSQHEEDLVLGLGSRARYGGVPWFPDDGGRDRLSAALNGVPVHAVRLPFPTDPRPVARLIASLL